MFKVKSTKAEKFDEVMYKAVFTTVRDALESILKMEYKTADGKEIDYEVTARSVKAQARIPVVFHANIKQSEV